MPTRGTHTGLTGTAGAGGVAAGPDGGAPG